MQTYTANRFSARWSAARWALISAELDHAHAATLAAIAAFSE